MLVYKSCLKGDAVVLENWTVEKQMSFLRKVKSKKLDKACLIVQDQIWVSLSETKEKIFL